MDKRIYNILLNKLDKEIEQLHSQVSHPVTSSAEFPHSVGLIKKDTNISALGKEQLALFHSMLHMFHTNKSGKGLSKKTIEQLHRKVVDRLEMHKPFDKLDETLGE